MANNNPLTRPLPDLCLLTTFDHLPIQALFSTVPLVCRQWHQLQSPALSRRRHLVLRSSHRETLDQLYEEQFTIRDTPLYLTDLVLHDHEHNQDDQKDLHQLLRAPYYGSVATLRDSILHLSAPDMTTLPDRVIHLVANRTRNLTTLGIRFHWARTAEDRAQQMSQLCRLLQAMIKSKSNQQQLTSLAIHFDMPDWTLAEPVIEALNHMTGLRTLHLQGLGSVPKTVPLTLLRTTTLRRFDSSNLDQWWGRVGFSSSSSLTTTDHPAPAPQPPLIISRLRLGGLVALGIIAGAIEDFGTGLGRCPQLERVVNLELCVLYAPPLYCRTTVATIYQGVIARMKACRSMVVTVPALELLPPLVRLFEPLRRRLVLFKLVIQEMGDDDTDTQPLPPPPPPPPPPPALDHLQPLESVRVLVIHIETPVEFKHHDLGLPLLQLAYCFPRLQVLHLSTHHTNMTACEHCFKVYYDEHYNNNDDGTWRLDRETDRVMRARMAEACRDAILANLWHNCAPLASLHTIHYRGARDQHWSRYNRPPGPLLD